MLSIILIVVLLLISLFFVAEFRVIRKAFDNNRDFLKKYIPYLVLFHVNLILIGIIAYGFYILARGGKAMNSMSDQWFNFPSYNNEGIALMFVLVIFISGNYLQHRYIWSLENKVNTYLFTIPSQLFGLLILLLACAFGS